MATNPKSFIDSPDALSALDKLRAGSDGIHTSVDGRRYNNTIFGRDSSVVGGMLAESEPDITRNIIKALAKLQGTKTDYTTGEELGRIHHEYRTYKDWRASAWHKTTFKLLATLWGGDRDELLTYFSMDSTPLYMLMVNDYASTHLEILDETVTRRDGKEITIRRSLEEAAHWTALQVNNEGLVEVPRRNFFSLMYQSWKDSATGYVRPDGSELNINKPIAYVEMQGLVAEALSRTAQLLGNRHSQNWIEVAAKVQAATLAHFWEPEEAFFASTIEHKRGKRHAIVSTLESDPGWLLNTTLFERLSSEEREKYVGGIVRRLFSDDFMTDAGVRTRALRYKGKLLMADYHGSYSVWPLDSYMFMRGLRRHNLNLLADQVEARVLDAMNKAGNFYEFFFVDANNRVVYDPQEAKTPFVRHDGQHVINLYPETMPESNLAWSVALTVRLHYDEHHPLKAHHQEVWQRDLEQSIMKQIKHFSLSAVLATKKQPVPDLPPVILHAQAGKWLGHAKVVQILGDSALQRLRRKIAAQAMGSTKH